MAACRVPPVYPYPGSEVPPEMPPPSHEISSQTPSRSLTTLISVAFTAKTIFKQTSNLEKDSIPNQSEFPP